jgi:hypothetical protein
MANSCTAFRTNLAALTPVFDKGFLHDWSPMTSAYMGKHMTGVWGLGEGDTHIRTRVTIGYPNLMAEKRRISSAECGTNACSPPVHQVAFGTNRTEHFMENWAINSQPFCLTQLRYNTDPQGQATEIVNGLKKIPEMESNAYTRARAFSSKLKIWVGNK